MDFDFAGMGTIIGGIAGSVILAAAVAAAVGRLWHYRVVRLLLWPVTFPTKAVTAAIAAASTATAEKFVRPIVKSEVDRIMHPNGGNSLYDVSGKIDSLQAQVAQLAKDAEQRSHRREDKTG